MTEGLKPELERRSHPLRATLSHEMHSRKLPPFGAPARLVQLVMLCTPDELDSSLRLLAEDEAFAGIDPDSGAKHIVRTWDDASFVWERHTEFATYTLVQTGPFEAPFAAGPFDPLIERLLPRMPGKIIRSTRIALIRDASGLDPRGHFAGADLVVCDVADGKARIWSDFRLHDGFGRLLIEDRGLSGAEPAHLVQALQELGNYRKLALLGLPLAQQVSRDVSDIENRLAELTRDVASNPLPDAEQLEELTRLSADLAHISATTRYRMSATQAYARLCRDRVDSLRVSAVPGSRTLLDFTQRRLDPAVRTCESFSKRVDDLSQRLDWTSSVLRTRIDTALAMQNRDLLASMDRRNEIQLRLQQTVEGLSLAAITYYFTGLAGYVFKALHTRVRWIEPELVTGLCAPIILAILYLFMRRWRARLHALD